MPFALIVALGVTIYAAVSDLSSVWRYFAVVVGIGLVRAVYGLLRTRSLGFLLFVLYGFIHVFVLIPVRLYALATMHQVHWGTRGGSDDDPEHEQARHKLVHSRSATARTAAENEWARDIRQAVERGDSFFLHWQPVCHLASGTVNHAEVLLRLRHDGLTIPPAGFLSIAEDQGVMPIVDRRVAFDTVAILETVSDSTPLRLEVNVSADSMRDLRFTELLDDYLRVTAASPRNLVLSVPDRVARAEPEAAAAFGRRVRALGCLFALDNFNGEGDEAAEAESAAVGLREDRWRSRLAAVPKPGRPGALAAAAQRHAVVGSRDGSRLRR
jgi:hypothetical protein